MHTALLNTIIVSHRLSNLLRIGNISHNMLMCDLVCSRVEVDVGTNLLPHYSPHCAPIVLDSRNT